MLNKTNSTHQKNASKKAIETKYLKKFKFQMIDMDTNILEVSKQTGKCRETIRRWMIDPCAVPLSDMLVLFHVLNFTKAEAIEFYNTMIDDIYSTSEIYR